MPDANYTMAQLQAASPAQQQALGITDPVKYFGTPAPASTTATPTTQPSAVLTTPPTTITNPNGPSSSATSQLNQQTGSATTAATAGPDTTPLSDMQNWYMQQTGLSEADVRSLTDTADKRAAVGAGYAQYQANQADLASSTAAEDASWQAIQDKFAIGRQGSLEANTAAQYSADPYAASSQGSGGQDVINQRYDIATTQAKQAHDAAIANLKAGNMKAAAANLNSIQQIFDTLNAQGITTAHNAATEAQAQQSLAQADQAKATTAFQAALATPSITEQATADLSALPSDWNTMTPAQKQKALASVGGLFTLAQKTGNYNGTDGNFDPAQAWTAVQGGLTNSIKQQKQDVAAMKAQSDIASATIRAQLAQANLADKQAAAVSTQTLASVGNGAYMTAFGNAQLAGNYSKAKVAANLDTLAGYAANGDVNNLKNGIAKFALSTSQADADTFTGLQALSSTLSGLKAKIAALPADQQTGFLNGNVNDIAAKYGQSTDPKLRTIGQEFAHLGVYYGKAIGGVRGAVSAAGSNGTVFQSLVPNIKEGKNLILSDIDGFNNTAADLVDNTVAAKIGQDTFSQIYGDSVFPKAAAPAAAAPVTMYLNGKSYPIDPSKVDIAKQNGMTLTQ